jgi:hypothetical protein
MYENLERVEAVANGREKRYKRDVQTENVMRRTILNAEAQGMRVNLNKTAMLTVSDAITFDPVVYVIDGEGTRLESKEDTVRILGFHFGPRPTVEYQVEDIIRKVRRRYWVIRHLKKHGLNEEELVRVYCSIVRSVIEYTSVVYGPMLTADQALRLERLQSQSLKIIYGFNKSAREVRELAGIETLAERRARAVEKFAKKSYEGRFAHWFPENPATRRTRGSKKFQESYARCDRLKNTPIFHMRRIMNELYSVT